jgi:hypothetical protein
MAAAAPTKPSTGGKPADRPPLTMRQKALLARQYARTTHRHTKGSQKQVAPVAAMGVLVLASAALTAAKAATDADAAILGGTAATCVVIAVVAAHQFRHRLDDRKSVQRGIAFVSVCAGWLTTTTMIGLSLDAVAVLAALGAALSLHWWHKKRIPNTAPMTAAPTLVAESKADQYVARWNEFVACPGGQLPGSKLESPERINAGWRYVLRLVPGKQSIAGLMSSMELLRGGLGLTLEQDLVAEKHPVFAQPAVLLTVVTKSPIKDAHEWPGPESFRDGYVDMGPFVDGEGHARWKVYTQDRMVGGYIQGGSGAGKSRLIEAIVMPIADSQTHPTVIWFGDGQGNSSSPMLMKHADYSARTHEQIGQMVVCAQLIMELRQDENGLDEEVGFTPTDDRPGLLVVIDECHKPLSKIENPEQAEGLQYLEATIAREGQKVGVQLLLASQESTLGAFGGAGNAAEMLRSNLLMGNGVMMRSKDANARQVFKVAEDPSQFPALPGYALLIDPEEGARTAPFRGYHLTDRLRKFWPDRIRWRELDIGSANAAGMTYIMRRELADLAREEIRRRVEARRNGTHLGPQIDRIFNAANAARGGDGAEMVDVPPVAQFPVWDPNTDRIRTREMHDGHRKVLDALRVGFRGPSPIAEATGYSVRRVHQLLDELMDEFGLVERVLNPDGSSRHGEYRLAEVVA